MPGLQQDYMATAVAQGPAMSVHGAHANPFFVLLVYTGMVKPTELPWTVVAIMSPVGDEALQFIGLKHNDDLWLQIDDHAAGGLAVQLGGGTTISVFVSDNDAYTGEGFVYRFVYNTDTRLPAACTLLRSMLHHCTVCCCPPTKSKPALGFWCAVSHSSD